MSVINQHFENLTNKQIYLDWANDWLTVEKMAEFYRVSPEVLSNKINLGRAEHNRDVLISKIYDYIADTAVTQGRLLDADTLYGDGSRFENKKPLFDLVYNQIKKHLENN